MVAVEAAVLATGAAVPAMAAELGLTIPEATPISLLVTSKPVEHQLTAVLNAPRASVRPTPDGALAVDSDWTMATRHAGDRRQLCSTARHRRRAAGRSLQAADGNPRWRRTGTASSRSPIPGDGEPVLGAIDDVAGLYVAFTHSGATLGLIAGELLAYEIVRGTAHPMLADFNVRRFALTRRSYFLTTLPDPLTAWSTLGSPVYVTVPLPLISTVSSG